LFSDPHLKLGGIGLRALGGSPQAYRVSIWASLV
jgi:hypothetical protein